MVDNSASLTIYPHTTLTRLHGPGHKPTRKQILLVQLELDANSSSVDSVFGNHGHVFLTLSPAEYADLHGAPFQIPEQPPMDPTPPPGGNANPTAAQLAEALRLRTNAWKAYKLMRATERNLRNQLLAAADNVYWQRLRHVRLGYNMCSIQDMLNHLIESNGRFHRNGAQRSREPDGSPLGRWTALEFVIQQISDAADAFALAGTPLLAQQKTDKLYDLVKESGLLSDACQGWRMFPTGNKTWAAATAHFQQYANDRDEELTTETAGYQRANHVQTNSNTGTLGDITSQLANLAARDESRKTEFRALQAELATNKAESAAPKAMFTAYKEANKGRGNNEGESNKTVAAATGVAMTTPTTTTTSPPSTAGRTACVTTVEFNATLARRSTSLTQQPPTPAAAAKLASEILGRQKVATTK